MQRQNDPVHGLPQEKFQHLHALQGIQQTISRVPNVQVSLLFLLARRPAHPCRGLMERDDFKNLGLGNVDADISRDQDQDRRRGGSSP